MMILTRKDYKKLEKRIEKLEKNKKVIIAFVNEENLRKQSRINSLECDLNMISRKIEWIIPLTIISLIISITALGIAVCALL